MAQPPIERIGGLYYIHHMPSQPTVVYGQWPEKLPISLALQLGYNIPKYSPQFPNQQLGYVAQLASVCVVTHHQELEEAAISPQPGIPNVQSPFVPPPSGYDPARIDMFNAFTTKLLSGVDPTWWCVVGPEVNKDYFKKLCIFLFREIIPFFPPLESVFYWTKVTPISNIRVVIIGQDPYYKPGLAYGLAFGVQKGYKIPRSEAVIFKEVGFVRRPKVESNETIPAGWEHPGHGDLSGWAKQGVLLLNAVLTVSHCSPDSHKNQGWETFTDAIISWLTLNKTNLVFMLWGKKAQEKGAVIKNHHVLWAAHPSYTGGGFSGCDHFSLCNQLLALQGSSPINWNNLP